MAYGPHSAHLLEIYRLAQTQEPYVFHGGTYHTYGKFHVDFLNIHSLPELLPYFREVSCPHTLVAELPPLPESLEKLFCFNTKLTKLPPLPDNLEVLSCPNTKIKTLPELPKNLKSLLISNTLIEILPELPESLTLLLCENTPLLFQRKEGESIREYNERWRAWREEKESKERIKERCAALKEEIIMAAWHPQRVEKWVEAGIDFEDM